MLHMYGFTSLPWVRRWAASRRMRLNDFPHSLQLRVASDWLPRGSTASSWVRRCSTSPFWRLNVRPQCWHCNPPDASPTPPPLPLLYFCSLLWLGLGCMYTFTSEFSSSSASRTSVGSYRYSITSSFFILSLCYFHTNSLQCKHNSSFCIHYRVITHKI